MELSALDRPAGRVRDTRRALPKASWALTEQPRAINRDRLTRSAGQVDSECLAEVDQWLRDFIGLN